MPSIKYDLPDDLHRRAKAAAALQGVTLKDFILGAIEAAVEQAEAEHRPGSGTRMGKTVGDQPGRKVGKRAGS